MYFLVTSHCCCFAGIQGKTKACLLPFCLSLSVSHSQHTYTSICMFVFLYATIVLVLLLLTAFSFHTYLLWMKYQHNFYQRKIFSYCSMKKTHWILWLPHEWSSIVMSTLLYSMNLRMLLVAFSCQKSFPDFPQRMEINSFITLHYTHAKSKRFSMYFSQ